MYDRILVPTDGSDVSAAAEQAAIAFARAHGSEVVVLAVGQPQPPIASAEAAMAIDPGLDDAVLLSAAKEHARNVANAAEAAGVRCTSLAVLDYSPADAILATADSHACDLIFMGSHGRRGLSRLLAGSVTQKVLAEAHVPVMVMRPRAAERK
ncbi:universal stress protein [Telluria mixta]|uniref:Universal stress protein n=1 Tax=Telluria mixta TaxID=34071 RepID=A0ABT2C7D4_9BURK|nr:universal stress protein [Telluria mixta]MCS0633318.1 universal stress protein [Telluria mixta]WEM94798.1 universal stress protein [Telluria mixta]